MRTVVLTAVVVLLLIGAGMLWWTGRGPAWLRPDFQAARDDIETKTRELESAQSAIVGLSQRLRSTVAEAETERRRARDLAEIATARASEVGQLQARLRGLREIQRSPVPQTLTEGVHALADLGY